MSTIRRRGTLANGSSPRRRGTPSTVIFSPSPRRRGTRHRVVGAALRFIPAQAGNTHLPVDAFIPAQAERIGSSPRRRGTLAPTPRSLHPRQAGNTTALVRRCRLEHPRAGGEHGSSPRRRGTLSGVVDTRECFRFIPAQAGNTNNLSTTSWSTAVHPRAGDSGSYTCRPTVHPRAGGEHIVRLARFSLSPLSVHPRAGGEHRSVGYGPSFSDSCRFIPAQAGNTTRWTKMRSELTGSSPRRRGTQLRRARAVESLRFIPAQAGNTRHQQGRPAGSLHRFIPAQAGNTLLATDGFREDFCNVKERTRFLFTGFRCKREGQVSAIVP